MKTPELIYIQKKIDEAIAEHKKTKSPESYKRYKELCKIEDHLILSEDRVLAIRKEKGKQK